MVAVTEAAAVVLGADATALCEAETLCATLFVDDALADVTAEAEAVPLALADCAAPAGDMLAAALALGGGGDGGCGKAAGEVVGEGSGEFDGVLESSSTGGAVVGAASPFVELASGTTSPMQTPSSV